MFYALPEIVAVGIRKVLKVAGRHGKLW